MKCKQAVEVQIVLFQLVMNEDSPIEVTHYY